MASGGLFVMIYGISMMHESFVVNLGILMLLVLHILHTSVLEVAKFGWTMYNAKEMKVPLCFANTLDGV